MNGVLKKISSILLTISILSSQLSPTLSLMMVFADETTKKEQISDKDIDDLTFSEDEHYRYYYEQLTTEAKKIYDAIYYMYRNDMLKDGKTNYELVNNGYVSEELVNNYIKGDNSLIIAVETARDAFYLDYPEVFYLNMEKLTIRITKNTNNKYLVWLGTGNSDSYYLHGFSSNSDVESAITTFNNRVDEIVNGAKNLIVANGENLIEKQIRYVHDEIIKSTVYRLDDVAKSENLGHIRTPYGALVAGESVCEGYSKALKVILDKLGIPSILIRGAYQYNNPDEVEGHMWNYVQIDGKWYAVDVTFDDLDQIGQYGNEVTLTDYFLAGEGYMSRGHYPDGIMSAPEFEFKYPQLEYYYYGSEEVANASGLKVIYSEQVGSTEDTLSVFDVSYKGMNYKQAADSGYYYLIKYYQKVNGELKVDGWFYLGLQNYVDQIKETDDSTSFQISFANMEYIELAITDQPVDDRAYSSDPWIANQYQRYQGNESEFLATSGVLECPGANYIAPPRFASAYPYIETKLKPGVKQHIKITYDKELKKTSDDVSPYIYLTIKNAWTSSAEVNSKIENFYWDGNNVVEFDFTPSNQYGDNSVIYYFNISGLVGVDSGKIPEPAYYYVQETFGCTYGMAQSKAWRVYGRPTLIKDEDIDVEGWTLSDGVVSESDANLLNQLTDRMALVVSNPTTRQEEAMEELMNNTGDKILNTEMYNINLILCNKNVLKTANGHKVTIYLGFPEGYGPESEGVTFKVYHFIQNNGVVTGIEEIDCVVTPYGLMVTCDSFSPYAVAVVEKNGEEVSSKSIVIHAEENGSILGLDTSIITLEPNEEVTYKAKANSGYQIDKLSILGKEVKEATGLEEYDVIIKYDDLKDSVNIVNATFVSDEIIRNEVERGEVSTIQTAVPAEIEIQDEIYISIGEEVSITPTITSSNGINTYQWYRDGIPLIGKTNSTLTFDQIREEDLGAYTLSVTSTVGFTSENVLSTPCKISLKKVEPISITSNKYQVNQNMITGITPNTSINSFKQNVIAEGNIVFISKDGKVLNDNDVIGTGTTIQLSDSINYQLSVKGDVDSDGEFTINDLAISKLYLIGKIDLSDVYLNAIDMNQDSETTIDDIAKMKLVLIGKSIIE